MSKVFCRNYNPLFCNQLQQKMFRCLMRAFCRLGRYIPFSKSRKCLKMQMSQSMNTFKQCKTKNLNYKPNHCSISSVLSILERIHGPSPGPRSMLSVMILQYTAQVQLPKLLFIQTDNRLSKWQTLVRFNEVVILPSSHQKKK